MIFRSNQTITALNAIYIEGSEGSRDNKDKRVDLKEHRCCYVNKKLWKYDNILHAGNTHI